MAPSLQEAINLVRAGRKEEARVSFMQIIRQNPHNETAWLWLSDCLPDDRQRILAFETCLRFNPSSHRARVALDLLLSRTSGRLGESSGPEPAWSQGEPAQLKTSAALPRRVPDKTLDEDDGPFVPEPPKPVKVELSARGREIQPPPEPKGWKLTLPAWLRGKPAQGGIGGNPFRWAVIAGLAVLVVLIAASAVMVGLSNQQVSNLSAIRMRSTQPAPATPNDNLSQASSQAESDRVLPLTGLRPKTSPTPSPSPAPPLPTGQAGASINVMSSPAATLPKPLSQHSASLLSDGRVLIAGGYFPGGAFGLAYLYDPSSDSFTPTGSLFSGRYGHSAVLLSDGRVLVTGGKNHSGDLNTSELFDPASAAWTLSPMAQDHGYGHTATLMLNGQVLVAGGCTASGPTDAAELYDPVAKTWTRIEAMPGKRCNASATRLIDGRILIVGESPDAASAVIYDPGNLGWTPAAAPRTPRSRHAATLLTDGRVLVSGGQNSQMGSLNSIEVYDPAKDTWAELSAMRDARFGHSAVLLPDARLVVIGGFSGASGAPLSTVEVYYPGNNVWSEPASLGSGLGAFSATLLPEGKVFLAGGTTDGQDTTDATELLGVVK